MEAGVDAGLGVAAHGGMQGRPLPQPLLPIAAPLLLVHDFFTLSLLY